MTPVCPHCGTPLDLDGLCPRCVALEFLTPLPPTASGPTANVPASGEHLRYFGDYEILNEIAHGGMGVVYRARQVSLNRVVAVKMLLVSPRLDPSFRERFHAEANAAASLHHPGIVTIHEVGEHEGMPYFSMDFIAGKTLAELTRDGALPTRDAAEYLRQAAAAVQHAHDRGIIHRDLKPSNVMVDENGQVRVTDFGLAKRMDVGSDLTLTGHLLGTPGYIAPEQAGSAAFTPLQGPAAGNESHVTNSALKRPEGRAPAVAADVYSLGATLYHLLTGRAPFTGSNAGDVLRQVAEADPVALTQLNPSVPRDLETITLKCLEKEISRRYSSASQLAEELGRFLRGEPIHARPASPAEKLWRWSRRQPALAAALAACALILVAGIAGIVWQLRQTEAARTVAEQKARDEQAQRTLAERSELVMRQNLYAADMLGAQRALEQNDLGTTRLLLDTHRPATGQADLRGFEWRYLWGKSRGDSAAVLKHTDVEVTALAFAPDGSSLAIGSWRGFLHAFPSLELRARAEIPNVQAISFIPGGKGMMLGIRVPSEVWRWDMRPDSTPTLFLDPKGRWPNVAVSPKGDVMAVGTGAGLTSDPEGTTALYDAVTAEHRAALPGSGGMIAFSPDGKLLATGSWQGTIKLWNPDDGKLVGTLPDARRVISLRFSPDSSTLVFCSFTEGVWLHDLATGTRRAMARGHADPVWGAEISPDGRTLATCSPDQTVRLWDIQTGQQKARFLGHSYGIARLAWSPDGTTLASGGQDGTTRLWDIKQTEVRDRRVAGFVRRRFFPPDGKSLIVARQDGSLTLVEFPSLKKIRDLSEAGEPLGFLPDGRTLLTLQQRGNNPPRLASWGVPNLDSLTNTLLPGVTNQIFASALSSNGNWLAIGLGKGEIGLWDLSRGRMSQLLSVPLPQISHAMTLAFSPDGRFLVGTFTDSTIIQLWDIPNSFQRTELGRQRGWIYHLVFTPDGRFLISADGDKFIKIWDLTERKEVTTLLGHRNSIISLDISPDGRTLASASSDKTLRLWNLPTHREVARFELESNAYPIAFAPDSNALLLSSRYNDQPETATTIWSAPSIAEADAHQRETFK